MSEEPETVEDNAAGILNGVMIFLLGAAFAALMVWQAISRRDNWAIGLNVDSLAATGGVCALAIFSFLFMRTGVRMIRRGVSALQRRRRRSQSG